MKRLCYCLWAALAVSAARAEVSIGSPLFAVRNTIHVDSLDRAGFQYMGLKTLDGGIDYAAMQAAGQAPAQNPGSLSATSVCIGSACAGSICLGSACAGSFCFGSACGTSHCGGSACASSICGGSSCVGSVCAGSVCVGSGCAGSICLGPDCGGGESFPLINACDYRVRGDDVILTLGVSHPARVAGSAAAAELRPNRLNTVTIPGAYKSVSFTTTDSGLEISLLDREDRRVVYSVQRS